MDKEMIKRDRRGGEGRRRCTPEGVWAEYQRGINYNTEILLYERVERNENFFNGNQWIGLKAPDIETPTLNFLERVVTYFIAMLVSDDVGINIKSFKGGMEADIVDNVLQKEIERVIERTKAKTLHRDIIRDAAVDGDGFFFLRFDPNVETGQESLGEICIETINNTDVIFGNPYDRNVQSQPYILIVQRRQVNSVKMEAREDGNPEWDLIQADSAAYPTFEDAINDDLVTVITKLWFDKETQSVHWCKCTENVMLKDDIDLGYKLYPIAMFNWKKVRNSYHGVPAITDGVIHNQIYVNTMWALFNIQTKKATFPTIFYDRTKIDRWDNRAGAAIATVGSPDQSVAMNFKPADFSRQAVEIVQMTIDYTKEFMGASDAALGNVKPENTSAIIAVQKASAVPLELQRLGFYQFVEDYVRIIIDMICTDYGLRESIYAPEALDEETRTLVDFSLIKPDLLDLSIDIGSSAYFSELTQIQTADNLFANGVIQDAELYLESIPDKYIKNKDKIIESIQAMKQQQMMQAMPQQAGGLSLAEVAAQMPI